MSNPLLFLIQAPAYIRITAFFILWLIVWLPIVIPLAIVLKWHPLKPLTSQQKLPLVASLYVLAPIILWGFSQVEQIPFSQYGLDWAPSVLISLGIGFAIAVLGLIGLFTLQNWAGWLTWSPQFWLRIRGPLLPILLLGLWISVTEELVFRGFLVNQLQRDYSLWITAIASSVIFAVLHLVWDGREAVPQLPGLWFMGMVLVLARWVDRDSLGLACGLHAGWIWGMASLDTANAIAYTGQAPEWLTGVAGKPLAGAIGVLFLLVTGLVLISIKSSSWLITQSPLLLN